MATETWRHGQKHFPARMGESSWDAQLQYSEILMATQGESERSRDSQKAQWRCAVLSRRSTPSIFNILRAIFVAVLLPIKFSTAVYINFDNCLSPDIINSDPQKLLQFVPLFVWATFNTSAESYNLNVTAYGNVLGIATAQPYPNETDPQWTNPNATVGKIPDVYGSGSDSLYTTFTTEFNVLDYTPYAPDAARFCNTSSLRACPIAPVFDFNGTK